MENVYFCNSMIQAANIHKSFGRVEVLKGVDLSIAAGEVVALVGASGAGKTTLLQIVGTLSRPDAGTVRYDGRDVFALSDRELSRFRNEHIGFVFQLHRLLPEFTLAENVSTPALIAGRGAWSCWTIWGSRAAPTIAPRSSRAARRSAEPWRVRL